LHQNCYGSMCDTWSICNPNSENHGACSGLLRQPKWGHLRDLHKAIKQAEPALVSGDPTIQSLGNYEKVVKFPSENARTDDLR
jgi:hypothetical protein